MLKFEVGKDYLTRDGRLARVLAVGLLGPTPVVALLHPESQGNQVMRYYPDGGIYPNAESTWDLVSEAPKTYDTEDFWVNINMYHDGACIGGWYRSEDEANRNAISVRIDCVKHRFKGVIKTGLQNTPK